MNQHVATLSITVNDKTLNEVKYVNCNLTLIADDGNIRVIPSDKAYIVNITKPGQPLPTEDPVLTTNNYYKYSITNLPFNTAHKENLSAITMITSILLLIIIIV